MKRTLIVVAIVCLAIPACFSVRGHDAGTPTPSSTTRPAATPKQTQDATGQVVAQAELLAEIRTEIQTAVRTEVAGVRYESDFGLGAAMVVGLALVLTLVLSHIREMARIKASCQHVCPWCGGVVAGVQERPTGPVELRT